MNNDDANFERNVCRNVGTIFLLLTGIAIICFQFNPTESVWHAGLICGLVAGLGGTSWIMGLSFNAGQKAADRALNKLECLSSIPALVTILASGAITLIALTITMFCQLLTIINLIMIGIIDAKNIVCLAAIIVSLSMIAGFATNYAIILIDDYDESRMKE